MDREAAEDAPDVDYGRFELIGFIWKPKPTSRRWQYRQHLEGRPYGAEAVFVPVYAPEMIEGGVG